MPDSKRARFVHWIIIGLVITIIYLPATRLYFYADDFTMLGWFRNETSWVHSLIKEFQLGYGFRPIMDLSLWATYHWFGWNPAPYYLLSILQHWVASILVYILAGRLFPKKPVSLWAGLIFGTALSHQEVITWISAAHVSLLACFYLGAILAYLHWREGGGWVGYFASLGCFLAATLTSQDAISLILVLTVTELFYFRHDRPKWWRRQPACCLSASLSFHMGSYKP